MDRSLKKSWILRPLAACAVIGMLAAAPAAAAETQEAPPAAAETQEAAAPEEVKNYYELREARNNPYINPHQQISDEGDIIWESCLTCHTNLPDIKAERRIEDVSLRHSDDPDKLCRSCHVVEQHPAREGIGPAMMQLDMVPEHLVEPSRDIEFNIRMSMKEVKTILPRDPATGRILCVTCHNPHERGLVRGRSDTGGDSFMRLRTPGLDICQYCHRK